MPVRIVNMRGVNLNLFDFDFDLTWAALFMNADGAVYGRYGGRDEGHAEQYLSTAGLKFALEHALAAYRADPEAKGPGVDRPERVEQYAAARPLDSAACVHCHQVYDFRRDVLKTAGKWRLDDVWVYPPPKNIGLTLDVDSGRRVRAVAANSPSARVGLQAGDELVEVNGLPIASFADLQYALHRAPAAGEVAIRWRRAGREATGALVLVAGWRRSDISWRGSMWSLEPTAAVHGGDLSADEKRQLGLEPSRLAFRHGRPLTRQGREAGFREGDIVLGIDDLPLEMTFGQFEAYIRLNHKTGDRVVFNVIRDGKRIELPMPLPAKVVW